MTETAQDYAAAVSAACTYQPPTRPEIVGEAIGSALGRPYWSVARWVRKERAQRLPKPGVSYAGEVVGYAVGEYDAGGNWQNYPSTRVWVQLDNPYEDFRNVRVRVTESVPA